MELTYHGANCVRISTKKAEIVVDDNLNKLGLKSITKAGDISLRTHQGIPNRSDETFTADMPGEYEISGIVIHGVAARGHTEGEDKKTSTIFTLSIDDLKIAVMGHIFPDLSDSQIEAIGHVDVMVVPIGDNGYTLDGTGALQIIKKIEPRAVIPTHYNDKAIKYEVPQSELAEALKNLAMEPSETLSKYKPKATELTDTTQLIVLERQ